MRAVQTPARVPPTSPARVQPQQPSPLEKQASTTAQAGAGVWAAKQQVGGTPHFIPLLTSLQLQKVLHPKLLLMVMWWWLGVNLDSL